MKLESSAADALGIECLWSVSPAVERFARDLDASPPGSPEELTERARSAGLEDLYPTLDDRERARIAEEGKIPRFKSWEERLRRREVAVDSLLSLAALESFRKDQAELDGRVRELIG